MNSCGERRSIANFFARCTGETCRLSIRGVQVGKSARAHGFYSRAFTNGNTVTCLQTLLCARVSERAWRGGKHGYSNLMPRRVFSLEDALILRSLLAGNRPLAYSVSFLFSLLPAAALGLRYGTEWTIRIRHNPIFVSAVSAAERGESILRLVRLRE